MNDFYRCNKITGIHWLHIPVENVKVIVKLKPQDGLLLPKFEDYINNSSTALKLESNIEEHIFEWQEKRFSLLEVEQYKDIHNCITENELEYHNIIKDLEYVPCKVFTYVHEDHHLPLPIEFKKNNSNTVFNLSACLERLNFNEKVIGNFGLDSVSMQHLLKSEENFDCEGEQWTVMHVMFDNSDHNEVPELVIKQEIVLLSLYYNKVHKYMLVSPDVNDLELNPYEVENDTGVQLGYKFAVDITLGDTVPSDDLMILLKKLYKKWERNQRNLISFVIPPIEKKHYIVSLEILFATSFDMDNLYVEYHIKLPESVQCNDTLHGRTHTSEALSLDELKRWNFGHIVELNFETNINADVPHIRLFFEVISKDWWCRHRTEGYSYLALSLQPGRYSEQLSCSRPEEKDSVQAQSRRFFVGGCHLIKDLEVLAKPQLQETDFTYQTTGTLNLRWNTISQSPTAKSSSLPPVAGTSAASALLLGAEAALKKYSKARARLAAATKDLDIDYEELGAGSQKE